jgi:hypothetical protein
MRLEARGNLRYREGDDPVEAYIKYKRKEALHRRGAVRNLAQVAALRAPACSPAASGYWSKTEARRKFQRPDLHVREDPKSRPI